MVYLYDKLGKTNLGALDDVISCFVIEERNGIFDLELEYPNGYPLSDQLQAENIIICDANDTLKSQKFRIYDTKKLMDDTIVVFARHISFDLMYDYIDSLSFENQSCEYALNQLFRKSNFSTHYKGYSDIINAQKFNVSMLNILEAIGGKSGSIIDTFGTGAEILRDNENIHVLNKRGYDNDVTIEYSKNLTGFELEEDTTELITRILPYAIYTNEDNEEITVKADYVDSPLISNYSHPYIKHIDYSDRFDEENIPNVSKLQTLAQNEYRDNKVDIPKQNFKIEFIPLSKCVGYEGLEDKISLCDTVTIKDSRYNINTQAKVIKVTFNVLKDRYESMELGEPRTSLGDVIGGGGDSTVGPPGPQGPPGADGEAGDFPDTLPHVPVVETKVYGFSNIEISWTFENKVYYQYEVYASKEEDFTPNTFNLIHQGQTSTYMYQAKPNETWHFKVCALNSHGNRTDFGSATAETVKIEDLSNYVEEMAINDALIGTLNLGRGWFGELRGNYIDAKQMSVTDGNGKRTLDIDSFGNVNLDVTKLSINSEAVATEKSVNAKIQVVNDEIKLYVKEGELDSLIQQKSNAVKVAFNNISSEWEFTNNKFSNKQDGYTTLSLFGGRLNTYSYSNNSFTGFLGASTEYDNYYGKWRDGVTIANTGNAHFINFGRRSSVYSDNNATAGSYDPILTLVTSPYGELSRGIYCLGDFNVNYGYYAKFMETITVPNIKGSGSRLLIYNQYTGSAGGGVELYVDGSTSYFRPEWNNGACLGSSSNRFKNTYLVNAPSVSSDASLKENIEYISSVGNTKETTGLDKITISDMYDFIKNDLKLVSFKYLDNEEKKYGFIAQDIKETKVGKEILNDNKEDETLSYDMGNRIAVLEGALQKAIEEIENLKKKNNN